MDYTGRKRPFLPQKKNNVHRICDDNEPKNKSRTRLPKIKHSTMEIETDKQDRWTQDQTRCPLTTHDRNVLKRMGVSFEREIIKTPRPPSSPSPTRQSCRSPMRIRSHVNVHLLDVAHENGEARYTNQDYKTKGKLAASPFEYSPKKLCNNTFFSTKEIINPIKPTSEPPVRPYDIYLYRSNKPKLNSNGTLNFSRPIKPKLDSSSVPRNASKATDPKLNLFIEPLEPCKPIKPKSFIGSMDSSRPVKSPTDPFIGLLETFRSRKSNLCGPTESHGIRRTINLNLDSPIDLKNLTVVKNTNRFTLVPLSPYKLLNKRESCIPLKVFEAGSGKKVAGFALETSLAREQQMVEETNQSGAILSVPPGVPTSSRKLFTTPVPPSTPPPKKRPSRLKLAILSPMREKKEVRKQASSQGDNFHTF